MDLKMAHVRGHIIDIIKGPIENTRYIGIQFVDPLPPGGGKILVSLSDFNLINSADGKSEDIVLEPELTIENFIDGAFYEIKFIGEEARRYEHDDGGDESGDHTHPHDG